MRSSSALFTSDKSSRILRIDIGSPRFPHDDASPSLAWIAAARAYLMRRYGAPTELYAPEEWAESAPHARMPVTGATMARELYEWRVGEDRIVIYGVTGEMGLGGSIRFEKMG